MKRGGGGVKKSGGARPSGGGLGALAALQGAMGGAGAPGAAPPMGPPPGAGGPPMPPPGVGGGVPGMKRGGSVKKCFDTGGKPHEDMPLRQAKRKAKELTIDPGATHEEKASAKGKFKYAKGGHVAHHGPHGDDETFHKLSHIGGHQGHGKRVEGAHNHQDHHHLNKAHKDHVASHKAFAKGGRVAHHGPHGDDETFKRVKPFSGPHGHGTAVAGQGKIHDVQKAHSDHVRGVHKFSKGGTPLHVKGRALDKPDGGTTHEEKASAKGEFKYAKGGHVKGSVFKHHAHGIESKGKTKGRYI